MGHHRRSWPLPHLWIGSRRVDTVRAAGGGSAGGGTRLTTAAAISAALGTVQKGAERSTPSEEAPQISRSAGYFPGTADAALAEFFTLAAGEERTGVDIRNALVRSSRLEGSVVGPNGQPLQHVLVGLANLSTGGLWASPGFVRPGADGRFSMASITPGRYAFFGRGTDANINPTPATPDASLPLWTWTEVTVKRAGSRRRGDAVPAGRGGLGSPGVRRIPSRSPIWRSFGSRCRRCRSSAAPRSRIRR